MKSKETLEIIHLGHPGLRKRATSVKNIFTKEIETLIDCMLQTLETKQGVGLAATQVNVDARIFIVAPNPTKSTYPNTTLDDHLVVINPIIKPISKKKVSDWEGCLSIPGIRGYIPRFNQINVKFTNRLGESVNLDLDGFVARIFQHEYDHLEGKVFLDRLKFKTDIITDHYYNQIMEEQE